jgi:prepilin-type processing-associated H-X9-DG protein
MAWVEMKKHNYAMVDGHLALLSIPSKENDPILSLEM